MHISVIGGGIVGVSTAYWLIQQGCEVTLFEQNDKVGMDSSYANGGQLSYSYVSPLAQPDVWKDLPTWLLKKDSPLHFEPQINWQLWRWLIRFLKSCNTSTANQSAIELLQLSFLSKEVLHDWTSQQEIQFGLQQNGKIIFHRDSNSFKKASKQVQNLSKQGAQQLLLEPKEIIALEPSLAPIKKHIVGAVYTPSEESGDCHLLTKALFELLEKNPLFTSRLNSKITNFKINKRQITAISTPSETIEVDQVVITNGIGSVELLNKIGVKPCIYPLKGYSLSLPFTEYAPKISVTDYAQRIVYAKLADQIRIAAMIDIGKWDKSANQKRIDLLYTQVKNTFPFLNLEHATPWVGLRPATPTGKPIIGRSQNLDNLWLNIGHGALGFTLASGSAALIGAQILKQSASISVDTFAINLY